MKYPRLYQPSASSSMLRLIPARLEQQSDVPQFEMRLESTLAEIGVVPKMLRPQARLMQRLVRQPEMSFQSNKSHIFSSATTQLKNHEFMCSRALRVITPLRY